MAQITPANIKQIRADVEAAMKAIYAKHGIDVVVGNIRYNAESFRCKIEGTVRGAKTAAPVIRPGISATLPFGGKFWFGESFDQTKTFHSVSLGRVKIVGHNSKAKLYPIIVEQVATGKKYKLSISQVEEIIASGVAA